MKAMILAAGKGERMMPLTRDRPKPLLNVLGRPLIQYHLQALARAGVTDIVINTARLGFMIEDMLGDGSSFGVSIRYSHEGDEPLGTGGGVQKALPLLQGDPFILINGDIWTDFDFGRLTCDVPAPVHLVMVDNPEHNPAGDFVLANGRIQARGPEQLTYSGIGVYSTDFFSQGNAPMFSFIPALKEAMARNEVSGEYFAGTWFDIGTPERLEDLEDWLKQR